MKYYRLNPDVSAKCVELQAQWDKHFKAAKKYSKSLGGSSRAVLTQFSSGVKAVSGFIFESPPTPINYWRLVESVGKAGKGDGYAPTAKNKEAQAKLKEWRVDFGVVLQKELGLTPFQTIDGVLCMIRPIPFIAKDRTAYVGLHGVHKNLRNCERISDIEWENLK